MYRTADPVEEYEQAAPVIHTAVASEALISVGAISITMAVIVVSCHLYRQFSQKNKPIFQTDDKLILLFFYSVVFLFGAVTAFNWR